MHRKRKGAKKRLDGGIMKYYVEFFDDVDCVTTDEEEFDTFEEAKERFDSCCYEGFMCAADWKRTTIILSQIDDDGLYGSLEEYKNER